MLSRVSRWKIILSAGAVLAVAALMLLQTEAVAQIPTDDGLIDLAESVGIGPQLGPVPVGGKWQEFAVGETGAFATGCGPADPANLGCTPSAAGNSEFAGAPPWTFSGATILKVTDAFQNDDRDEVFDNNVSIGLTSPPGGGSCGSDPEVCFADPNSSSGTFVLGPGAHSITIKAVVDGFGAHYFRVDAAENECVSPNTELNICELQAGDILLQNATGLSSLFSGFTGTYWFHSAIYDGKGNVIEARGQLCDSNETCDRTDEVRATPIKETGFYKSAGDWVVLRVKPEHQPKVAGAIQWAEDKANDPNVVFLPISEWTNTGNKSQDTKFYCSLLVWRAFKEQGLDLDFPSLLWGKLVGIGGGLLANLLLQQVLPDDLYASSILLSKPTTIVQDKNPSFIRTLRVLLSPADLRVIDSDGNVTGIDPQTGASVNEIPGAFYSGPDEEPEWVSAPDIKGPSIVEVHGAGSGTYTLGIQVFSSIQAEVFQWTTEPGQVDIFEVSDPTAGPVQLQPLLLTVPIDVKPGSDPNCIKDTNKGRVPVAILGSAAFDVSDIDLATIEIDDDTTPGGGVAPVRSSSNKDVSDPPDSFKDFVAHFNASDLKDAGLLVTDKELFVTGQLNDGTPILGGPDDVQIAGDPTSSCQD